MAEEVLGVLNYLVGDYKFIGLNINYCMYFTNDRIIVAKTLGVWKSRVSHGPESYGLKKWEVGLLKKWRKSDELAALDPYKILKDDSSNFSIPYFLIQRIEMKKPSIISAAKIRIKTPDKDHSYKMRISKKLFEDYVEVIRTLIPDKLVLT